MLKLKGLELTDLKEQKLSHFEKVDLSNNFLKNLEGVEGCEESLKWLNASHNQINSIKHLKKCCKLNVLNLGYNKISSTSHLKKLKELNALILNNNNLDCLEGISTLKQLNTLVVSSNSLETIDVTSLTKLQKLSASHNKFKEFPIFQQLKNIKDVKLNDNEIREVPAWFASCVRMKVMDLGNNKLEDFESIKVLSQLPNLENLNLKGNPLCNSEDYYLKIRKRLPHLKILDFKKFAEVYFKAVEEKEKRSCDSNYLVTGLKDSLNAKDNVKSDSKQKNFNQKTDTIVKLPLNRGFKSSKVKSKDTYASLQKDELSHQKENETLEDILDSKEYAVVKQSNVNEHVTKSEKEYSIKLGPEFHSTDTDKNTLNNELPLKKKQRKRRLSLLYTNNDPNDEIPGIISEVDVKKDIIGKHSHQKKKVYKEDKAVLKAKEFAEENRQEKNIIHKVIELQEQNSDVIAQNKYKSNFDGKVKKNKKEKSHPKKMKKSGIVAIKKVAGAKKKSKTFYSTVLSNDGTVSFGMGQDVAW